MVKITKTMQSKHKDSQSPWLKDYVQQTSTVPLHLLRQQLQKFPSRWPFTRGDVYHWIPVLNRFDSILEDFCSIYGLNDGPQVRDFGTEMLQREESIDKLQELGFGVEGDRELVESVLMFSRMLLNHCGNRSIYASSAHLDHILNTTSLSLIECTLLLGARLAQRYQASIKRMSSSARHYASASVLANHYSIDLDHVLQLALPFSRTTTTTETAPTPATPITPGAKGKDKTYFNIPVASRSSTVTVHANDLAAIVKSPANNSSSTGKAPEENWNDWGDVRLTYYAKQSTSDISAAPGPSFVPNAPPATPTPVRRTSNLGHGSGARSGKSSEESPSNIRSPPSATDDSQNSSLKIVELTSAQVTSTPIHQLLKETLPMVPTESKYELLSKIRVAKALTTSLETRRQILAIRLLAITNLSFIHHEAVFQEKVLKQDADEPRRLQLVYQLAEMAHPPAEGQVGVPRSLQTVALVTLEAFAHHTQKSQDVCSALNITVNHGILLYIVRKAVAEMATDDGSDQITEADEWRAALFDLLTQVNSIPRVGQDLVTAGIVGILVEVLNLRTDVAERTQPKVLTFLDSLMYSARDGFQTLVDADGLDAISNLIVYETTSGFDAAKEGKGIPAELCSINIDYSLPFYKQQTLKWLFKFIHHMMSAAGGYGGNFDRLLRNLIDSSQLLASLRQIITNASVFGSAVWTNAVSILNDFINNEPTSFAVIAEAGLSKGLLEAVSGQEIPSPVPEPIEDEDHPGSVCYSQLARDQYARWDVDWEESSEAVGRFLDESRPGELASGIMPTSETINIIPQAFGAICLNNAGMKMFLASNALSHFFEIFENPKHVLAMETDPELTANLGGTFDELVRHHPPLKIAIIHAVLDMVARVVHVCKSKSARDDVGAKLWTRDENGNSIIADGALLNSGKGVENTDVEMADAATIFSGQQPPNPDRPGGSIAPFISAVATFLSTIFSNATVRGAFADKGGIEYVIDLAELQSVTHEFADSRASRTLNSVISLLAEQKPHLVYPSLLKRSLRVLEVLKPFTSHTDDSAYFASFIDSSNTENEKKAHGTSMIKALISVQSLTNVLFQCFQPPTYNHRGPSNNINQLNLGDYYIRLVKALGPLLGASVREEIVLQKLVPDSWKSATRVKDIGFGNGVADDILGIQAINPLTEETPERIEGTNADESAPTPTPTGEPTKEKSAEKKAVAQKDRDSPEFKNFEVMRHLFSKMPRAISPFFQILGKALVSKRSIEPYQKQSSLAIAENISATMLGQLNFDNFSSDEDRFSYWVICLESINDILIDDSRHSERSAQSITIVLQAFKEQGGFDSINRILDVLTKEIRDSDYVPSDPPVLDRPLKLILAETGTKMILDTYQILSTGKNVVEASQTMAIMARTERDREKTDYFHSHQFIIEIRMNIIRIIRRLWESDFIDKASSTICNRLIDIIRTISEADNETSAHRRQDKIPKLSTPGIKPFKISQETYTALIKRWPAGLVKEALFRCNNNVSYTTEYLRFNHVTRRDGPRPDSSDALDEEGQRRSGPVEPSSSSAPDPMAVDSQVGGAVVSTDAPTPQHGSGGWDQAVPEEVGEIPGFNELLDSIANGLEANHGSVAAMMSRDRSDSSRTPSADSRTPMVTISGRQPPIVVEDLDEERAAIREKLIERSLDVINAHGNVTFEIADLITAVVHKSSDPKAMRKEVGQTLVQALMSFSTEEDVRPSGKKVAAYAHLLALMLQNKDFYKETLDELKENLPILLSFVRLSPGHTSDESSPWIAHVLLIIETLLSEDAQPQACEWSGPKDDSSPISEPVFKMNEQTVSDEDKTHLLELILDILPRIGKHQDLALAVLRILVILSRNRSIAQSIGEKKNIQRLFVMTKQLAGASTAKLQGPLMLILRHIIEDDETIKQIMRSEIKAHFEIPRAQRHIDVQAYLRIMSPLIIRSPKLFLQVSNEMIKLNKWVPAAADSPNRQHLVLKEPYARTSGRKSPEDSVTPTVQATEDLSIQDVKPSTEGGEPAEEKPKPHSEHKVPVVESPDGVIHFLLCELLNYRDVEDKEPAPTLTSTPAKETSSSGDATMTEATTAASTPAPEVKDTKKPAKLDPIKAEEHPIYIYRCFLLQCLTELLSCYNRTKIEFINFKRSAPPQSMTPSKPRTSVVNYLLMDLIPTGTLEHADTTALRKKQSTSGFADSLITALLSKTGEQIMDRHREPSDGEDEPDLLFVRRFVLENILKAYKEASASTEPLDVKYSRMMSLAELMSHIMSGKEGYAGGTDPAVTQRSQYQLKRVMFEKGFIGALTSSIADIDLNFPGAKRAVKYILKPLKSLTQTVIDLSESSTVVLGADQGEEDEISVASSMSDLDEEREETPDLFRNSTLGMFEPGRDDDSSSGSEDDDEEMYEGEYDEEEMEYDEEPDEEDNISDEDEDIEGMGPIEGLPGDHGVDVEVIMEDDEDSDEDGSSGSDEDEDSDDMDEDIEVDVIDEHDHDHDHEDDDEDMWESDDEEEDYEGQAADEEEEDQHAMDHMGANDRLGPLVRALAGDDHQTAVEMLQRMDDGDIEPGDDEIDFDGYLDDGMEEIDEEEDDEDDDEEESMLDGMYAQDYPMGDPVPPSMFGWDDHMEPPMVITRGGHRPRGLPNGFPIFVGRPDGRHDPLNAPEYNRGLYRSHRPGPTPRGADDGTNPLLQRTGTNNLARDNQPAAMGHWITRIGGANGMLDPGFGGSLAPFGEGPAALLNEIFNSHLPGSLARHGHLHFQVAGGARPGDMARDLQAMFGSRGSRYGARLDQPPSESRSQYFSPQSTNTRWAEEARILFGPSNIEKSARILNELMYGLIPAAREAEKIAQAAQEEKLRKLEEDAKKAAAEARKAEEELAAQEKKEKEEREAREAEERRLAAEAAIASGENPEAAAAGAADAMEGVEATEGDVTAEEDAAADRPRVTTTIRGQPYDITDLGIDAEFLAELPEEIREEVIMSAVAERRSQAAATGAQPSDIDQDFLDALPDDIRDEIIQQERQDRRRREREEARRNQPAANAGAGMPALGNIPADMDAASILATLSPALRQQVLLEQDDEMINLLPPELARQARELAREHGRGAPDGIGGAFQRTRRLRGEIPEPVVGEGTRRRTIVQMLDKPGVATLLRLMFVTQQGSLRSTLCAVLQNVAENRHNRAEVISTLLSVLQDGSADMSAVERSFAALSLRAKQPKEPKTPQSLKRSNTGLSSVVQGTSEISPLMVVQQCLYALNYLSQVNQHVPSFFLTEHESTTTLKRSLSLKGKNKASKASKYAINSLLTLLDRNLIMESSTVMESLSDLLSRITQPLQTLERRQKEAAEAEAKKTAEKEADAAIAAATAAVAASENPETEAAAVTEGSNAPATEAAKDKPEAENKEKEASKKPKPFLPPSIPEHNLKLVINIFVARECSSKTFRETISTIKNLSAIPGAKEVFGRELIHKAQSLGEVILVDLQELLPQIQKATSGTEIQGVALAKFSPGGSDQNKLLRVLTALDHLFDPKANKKDDKKDEADASQVEKQDLLASLYENSTFGPMWEKLSACLSAIRQREHMLNVATILLPLIESLMVVCKNTTLKDQPISRSQAGKDMALTSPPPDSRMESLFFTFTEEHRKILNDLVRHTPKLMSGTFSLLVKNPKVLEFDNKRNYFTRSIHNRTQTRQSFAPLQIQVRRDQVFLDSFKSLYFKSGDEMKFGKLSIRFHGEEGVDAGGVTREWFQVLSRQMFDPGYALFIPVSSDRTTFHPNISSGINPEHLMFFKFIGRIIGKALYEGRVLDCHFSRAVYKRILGKSVSVKDMESLDPDYYKSLIWMLENDITDIITETFSIDNDKFGAVETIDLIPDGRNQPVTEENKHEYVRLMVEFKLTGSVQEQLDEFLKGFHEIIPAELVAIFNEQELELLISGLPEIDVDDWKSNTEYHNYSGSSPQIQWFWRAVRSFDKEERAKLLQFVTGTSKVPLNGFKELEGMNGFSRFNIHRDYGSKDRLPSSHTCFNQLDLPEYESYEALRQQVLTAITAGSEYFGFA